MKKCFVCVALTILLLLCGGLAFALPPDIGGDGLSAVAGPFEPGYSVLELYGKMKFKPIQVQVFAEGCMDYGFETWLTLYNSSNQPATFSILVSGKEKYLVSYPETVSPHCRKTYNLIQFDMLLPGILSSPLNISVEVYASSAAVVAQESMYWNDRSAGHTSTGILRTL